MILGVNVGLHTDHHHLGLDMVVLLDHFLELGLDRRGVVTVGQEKRAALVHQRDERIVIRLRQRVGVALKDRNDLCRRQRIGLGLGLRGRPIGINNTTGKGRQHDGQHQNQGEATKKMLHGDAPFGDKIWDKTIIAHSPENVNRFT